MRASRAVVTGEGKLDEQTLEGKLVGEIGTRARQAGVPLHAIVGTRRARPVRQAHHRPPAHARGDRRWRSWRRRARPSAVNWPRAARSRLASELRLGVQRADLRAVRLGELAARRLEDVEAALDLAAVDEPVVVVRRPEARQPAARALRARPRAAVEPGELLDLVAVGPVDDRDVRPGTRTGSGCRGRAIGIALPLWATQFSRLVCVPRDLEVAHELRIRGIGDVVDRVGAAVRADRSSCTSARCRRRARR